ncbi:MAG: DUF4982 domain-containing protein [Clostridia bacterium]|nr:DUF4982 domain-containing protein [Clostridia bacterium]
MIAKCKIDANWLFHLGDVADADFMGYDDRAWRRVTLPHDWAVEHPFDKANSSGTGYLPGGTAWYRRHFELPEGVKGQRVRVTFKGVYKHSKVWINSNYLGKHAYGYTSFTYDITDFVRPGENVLAVRVEHEDVADSRWYTGSGIDRHVRLEITGDKGFAVNGVFARTSRLSGGEAELTIRYQTTGADRVAFALKDAEGSAVAQCEAEGECGTIVMRVDEPRLWSPETPYLYTLTAEAFSAGELQDRVDIPFGVREARFDADKGFFLNGVNMKLKGVCVHHDAGCLGAAVPKEVWADRIRRLKAMGCNALRTSHNPPDPDLLDLCDEMGLLVMDEAFDEWEGTKNKWWQGHNVYPPKHFGYAEDFPQWHEADLTSMIERDRNHPCVIMWSIGNEIDYPNDPYVTPLFKEVLGNNDANKPQAERMYDVRKPDAGRLATVARELTAIAHRVDDSRPVISALSFPELSNLTGFADALDMSGYNYREHFYEEDHAKYPGRVILGSENSHSPEAWKAVTDHDYIAGQFLWTGVDFLGECPGWPMRISQAGAMNLAGFEKPLYYLRKALWTDEPFAKIAVAAAEDDPRRRHESFRWAGAPGEKKTVVCYTNEPWAELCLNGVSLGKKDVVDGCACWDVDYCDGQLAVRTEHASDGIATPGAACELGLACASSELKADGAAVARVEIDLRDEKGNPATDECVFCQAVGDVEILGMENGRPDDLTPYSEKARMTLEGRAVVYVRAGRTPGSARLYARTASGLTASLEFDLRN